jgi:hypothetical protein
MHSARRLDDAVAVPREAFHDERLGQAKDFNDPIYRRSVAHHARRRGHLLIRGCPQSARRIRPLLEEVRVLPQCG